MQKLYDFSVTTIKGQEQSLADYRGQVLLVVNVASHCGFTPQYAELQKLYVKYRDQGFTVLAFPCNQFGHQEPGSHFEIQIFCQQNYGVEFPIFAKVDVNGDEASPLFQYLKQQRRGFLGSRRIKWNFTKFVIDRKGQVVKRYAPYRKVEDLVGEIEKLLIAP